MSPSTTDTGCALRALILRALDARDGHWVTLDWISQRTRTSAATAHAVCDALVDARLMGSAIVDGKPCFGVHADAASRVLS